MIEFRKQIKQILPYNRDNYLDFFESDDNLNTNWKGVSIKYSDFNTDLHETIHFLNILFKNFISEFNESSLWIVNHDTKNLDWFPNNENNLLELRNLFQQHNISNSFRGAIVFEKSDLLKYFEELIAYPTTILSNQNMLYKNIDISHSSLPFLFKTTGHLTLDVLSIDQSLLQKYILGKITDAFIIKPYDGTIL